MGCMAGAAYSPDVRRFLTGAMGDEAVRVWDLATRRELVRLDGKGSVIRIRDQATKGARNLQPRHYHAIVLP
jgi:hypothetical protein